MRNERKIYALGFFDGVHLGHQALLKACCDLAEKESCTPAAITFGAHPKSLFSASAPALLTTCQDRQALMNAYGISHIHCFPIDKKVMSTSWEDFLELLLSEGAAGFVCGHDFRFGHRGQGDAALLADYCLENNMPYGIVPEQKLGEVTVSSTHIRTLLEDGAVEEANRFLGHPHILSGEVVSGRKLGRTLGIPTANLSLPEEVVKLPFGVYACKAEVAGQVYIAVTNIGNRPTVGGHRVTVEPWLLDFEGDLYGKTLTLHFYRFLRRETKFPTLEALKEEILKNAAETRNFFENNAK